MTSPEPSSKQPSTGNVRRLLGAVRWRIRWLVLLEGIGLTLIAAMALFWLSLGIDYVPVKFGFEELSPTARLVILGCTAILLITVLVVVVGRRIFVSLQDRSMALLVERKYPQFSESLITAVESYAAQHPDATTGHDDSLMQIAIEKADQIAREIDPRSVLNDAHVGRNFYFVVAGLASLVGFALLNPDALRTAASRLYLLDDQTWPRESYLRWDSLKVEYDAPVSGIAEFVDPISPAGDFEAQSNNNPPNDSGVRAASVATQFRVGQGSTLNLTLAARSSQPAAETAIPPRRLPESCKLYFQSADGNYGSQSLNKVGGPRAGWQSYRLQGAPLTTMTSDLNFSVLGGDFRLGPFQIVVVDQPIVTATRLDCVYPVYMQDENSLRGIARTIQWAGKTELPFGTAVTIDVDCNKRLQKVYAVDVNTEPADGQDHALANVTSDGFEFPIPELVNPVTIQFYLVDSDGVISPSPHTISLSPITDQPPEVETMLAGIGSAITPNAVLPVVGTVTDDYDVDRLWLEIETTVTDTLITDVAVGRDGEFSTQYDFQEFAIAPGGFVLPTSGAEITLVLKASDRFNLGEGPNVGIGDQYTLSVVSPSQLLQVLEQLEVGQRKRLELIFNEVSDVREYLIRTRSQNQRPAIERLPGESAPRPTGGDDAGTDDAGDQGDAWGDLAEQTRTRELRKLFAQRAILQIDKSAKEIIGVAESFDDIRLQLINNRVDSEDRKIRLAKKIVQPLREIPVGVMTKLRSVVAKLESVLSPLAATSTTPQASPPTSNGLTTGITTGGITTGTPTKPFSTGVTENDTPARELTEMAIQLTDQTLIQLDDVLAILVKYETQNELLDIVRRMIAEQEHLLDQTKKLRQREAFDDLFE